MLLKNLRLAWWNTSLSSTAKDDTSNLLKCIEVYHHLDFMINTLKCDFIAISEVCSNDIDYFKKLAPKHIKILDLSNKAGRTRFDCAILYNSLSVSIHKNKDLTLVDLGQTVKSGQLIKLIDTLDSDEFTIALCHWSSQIMTSGEQKRISAANHLKFELKKHLNNNEKIIVMGDFNDEPYSVSLSNTLYTTRCIDAARKLNTELLYNPFWRHMSPSDYYDHSRDINSFPYGTHLYKSYRMHFWHMFDQILFSANFLGEGDWHLNEKETKIVKNSHLESSLLNKKSFIDHYPVMCEIIKP